MKLYGRNPVLERIKFAPRTILKIFLQDGHPDTSYIQQKAKQSALPVMVVPASKLQKMARNANTQGIVADVENFAYAQLADLLALEGHQRRVLVFVDELNDPQNLGAMLRSLACLGNFAVILPTHHSVEVTETVLRVACGGENYVPVVRTKNLIHALMKAREAGYWAIGTVLKGGVDIHAVAWQFPLAIVIGSEHQGVRDVVRQEIDCLVTVPMAQPRMVLNASHAATVFAYELMRHRQGKSS